MIGRPPGCYCSFAYSALASFRMARRVRLIVGGDPPYLGSARLHRCQTTRTSGFEWSSFANMGQRVALMSSCSMGRSSAKRINTFSARRRDASRRVCPKPTRLDAAEKEHRVGNDWQGGPWDRAIQARALERPGHAADDHF